MELRTERRDLFHELIGQLLPRHDGKRRNVVNRLLGIKLRTLTAGPVENIDHVSLNVEQAKLEHREEPHGPRADDDRIGLDDVH